MIGSLLIITGGLVLFALGAERIVRSSDAMARRLGFTPFFYALTVVALATSLPELVVNSAHAVRGNYSLVVDDVYGSIVFYILAGCSEDYPGLERASLPGPLTPRAQEGCLGESGGSPGRSVSTLAGGWKNTVSLKTSYQQADAETTLRVVLGAGELREAQ